MRVWTTDDRIAALRAYEILDTPPEPAFDDIVDLALTLTGAAVARISLLDDAREWCKAERGLGLRETPLATSFCRIAVDEDLDLLVIPDAAADARTRDMRMVREAPHLRSYAGVTLRAPEGQPLGAVCVLDVRSRTFSDAAVASLRALARQVSAQLELRRAIIERPRVTAELRETNLGRELAMQAARLGRWDHQPDRGRRFFDARAREILGLGERDDISVASLMERVDPRDRPEVERALAAVLKPDRTGPFDVEFRIGSDPRWISCVGRSLFEDGVCTRFFGVVRDVTEPHRLEDQRAYLAQELDHRVKNILSLAQAVADSTLRTAPDVRSARELLGGRLQALGRAHDVLLRARANAADLREVARATLESAGADLARVEIGGPPVPLGPRAALQLALAFHELTTNAGKYGALSGDAGRVALSWRVEPQPDAVAEVCLMWEERGGPPVTPSKRKGFGTRVLVAATESALRGTVRLDAAPEGLRWSVRARLDDLAGAGEPQPATQANL